MPRYRRGWAMRGTGSPENSGHHSPLVISMLEPTLLTLLNIKSRHGYTLLSDLHSLGMGTIHPSVVYRTLREMEDLAWVESDWDSGQSKGPPRRTYQLTPQGKRVLQNWHLELQKTRTIITQLLEY
jgi:DNA-binding PadR family transcriptional regulator